MSCSSKLRHQMIVRYWRLHGDVPFALLPQLIFIAMKTNLVAQVTQSLKVQWVECHPTWYRAVFQVLNYFACTWSCIRNNLMSNKVPWYPSCTSPNRAEHSDIILRQVLSKKLNKVSKLVLGTMIVHLQFRECTCTSKWAQGEVQVSLEGNRIGIMRKKGRTKSWQ